MIKCGLTGKTLPQPIYHSQGNLSINSLSKIYEGKTIIYLNEDIGHLQTQEIEDIEAYYDKQYQFFNQSEEDDVLYKVVDGKKIFRQEHQLNTLLSKIDFEPGMKILDYGCAKGTVMKRLSTHNPSIIPHLFDVSQMYVHLWEKFLPSEQYASYDPKEEWNNNFDVITSFFAFEHTPDPIKELNIIKKLLKPNGLFYCVVPNIYENTGDFIVADHVHHYSEISLRYMFAKSGFQTIEVDSQSHFAAFIIIGKNTGINSIPYDISQTDLANTNRECFNIANYWETLQLKIRSFEQEVGNHEAAIYGAGVYGNFIVTCIQNFDNIKCFIDQNPLLKGHSIEGKPILQPSELPSEINNLYIGLNPKISLTAISNIDRWQDKKHKYLFL